MPDYMYLLESRLSAEQRAALASVQEAAAASELNLYLVGGAVRDIISGMPIRDLDFTVEGNPARLTRDLEKTGAKVVDENETLRQIEFIFPGDVDVSIAAARDEVYSRPGTRPEVRFFSITEDLKRRDFSINAIALSLNVNSRGLLLDPANGLADLERREIRALSIHSFTNQPVRLLRALRYSARLGFKLDARTAEWFNLAIERRLHEAIAPGDAGSELRQLAREEKPAAVLKAWDSRGLLPAVYPQLGKRSPDYEALGRLARVREDMWAAGMRPRLFIPVALAIFGRLSPRERTNTLERLQFRAAEIGAVNDFESEAAKVAKLLTGAKTASPRDAYAFLEQARPELLAYLLAESSNAKVAGKIRTYLNKWRPLRQGLAAAVTDLEGLGMEHGAKFDQAIEEFFQAQLAGRARKPEDRIRYLRRFAGIKEPKPEVKKKPEKTKPKNNSQPPADSSAAARTRRGPQPQHTPAEGAAAKSREGVKAHPQKR